MLLSIASTHGILRFLPKQSTHQGHTRTVAYVSKASILFRSARALARHKPTAPVASTAISHRVFNRGRTTSCRRRQRGGLRVPPAHWSRSRGPARHERRYYSNAPPSRSEAISLSLNPSTSLSTSSVCWPSVGAADRTSHGVPPIFQGMPQCCFTPTCGCGRLTK